MVHKYNVYFAPNDTQTFISDKPLADFLDDLQNSDYDVFSIFENGQVVYLGAAIPSDFQDILDTLDCY